ncbi:MAG: hypothetical protein H6722_28645 [Sandaracinus sp.]|nr:hypothetical protein [Sandaracinus sp.]MCB9616424.1 hypothetical protein [Sandaracinus sp.]
MTTPLRLLLFVAIAGCADPARTELVIDVFAENAVVERADAVRLRLVGEREGIVRIEFDETLRDPDWPVRHVVAGRGGEWLLVEAFALRGEAEVSPVRARVRLEEGRSLWLPLLLSEGCWARSCSPAESCEANACEPVPVPELAAAPPSRRPANVWDGGLDASVAFDAGRDAAADDGGRDAGNDGGLDGGLDGGFDGGVDAGRDAGVDGGRDAGVDAGRDAGTDGGVDSGPLCPGGCDDGVACTVDRCTFSGCSHTRDDSLCVAPQTCDAVMGCRDASCTESPCRLVAPQCGCPSGQGCYFEAGSRVCRPAGTSTEGQACASDRCAVGLTCHDVSTTASSVPMCLRYCSGDASCSGGPGSRCLVLDGASSLCTANCDVVTQTGCPGNASCAILEGAAGVRYTHCSGPVGTGGQDAACIDDSSCQRGLRCVNTGTAGAPDNRCLRWCRRSAPTSSCPGITSCTRLGAAPGLVFNGAEYGVCF